MTFLTMKKLEHKQTAVYLYTIQGADPTYSYDKDNCQWLYDSHITAVPVVLATKEML